MATKLMNDLDEYNCPCCGARSGAEQQILELKNQLDSAKESIVQEMQFRVQLSKTIGSLNVQLDTEKRRTVKTTKKRRAVKKLEAKLASANKRISNALEALYSDAEDCAYNARYQLGG